MPTAQSLRTQIEASLAKKIPSALTPQMRTTTPVSATGIQAVDQLLRGGFPVGAITEIVGPECSGRTSLTLQFVASFTQAEKVCAWVDASDTLHPESAAAIGVDLTRLLWVRCGSSSANKSLPSPIVSAELRTEEKPSKIKPGLPQGGSGHPRQETNGLSDALSQLFGLAEASSGTAEPAFPSLIKEPPVLPVEQKKRNHKSRLWHRLEQALRATDLLLQSGGFACIVLDLGSMSAEHALRVPLATWFRFRGAAERWQCNVVLLTQHPCSRNSAGLVVRLDSAASPHQDQAILTGLEYRVGLERQRFAQSPGNVYPMRKPSQSVQTASWQGHTVWAGCR